MKKIKILNVDVDNVTSNDLLKEMQEGFVMTPNVDHLVRLQKDKDFKEVYENADYVLCDSRIVLWASKFLKTPIKEQIAGSDFFPQFCKYHGALKDETKIFLLGGRTPNIANRAASNINVYSQHKIVVGHYSPPFDFGDYEIECEKIIDMINRSGANVLAVGLGSPKQGKFIVKYRHKFKNIKIFFAIGATIDFESQVIKRAPRWMSKLGLEWFYRMMQDPKRLTRRYLIDDLPFFYHILKQKLGLYKDPFKNPKQNDEGENLSAA
jgi:N-acetylglucosaminyldiphosphoundecaprenol N-acetyl-beta-D-mannosaminyltransferase